LPLNILSQHIPETLSWYTSILNHVLMPRREG
jgi:hypothetical protein